MNWNWWQRIRFAARYRSIRPVVVDPSDNKKILVYKNGEISQLRRFCPHEGADLSKHYVVQGAHLRCGWHGCRFSLDRQ